MLFCRITQQVELVDAPSYEVASEYKGRVIRRFQTGNVVQCTATDDGVSELIPAYPSEWGGAGSGPD